MLICKSMSIYFTVPFGSMTLQNDSNRLHCKISSLLMLHSSNFHSLSTFFLWSNWIYVLTMVHYRPKVHDKSLPSLHWDSLQNEIDTCATDPNLLLSFSFTHFAYFLHFQNLPWLCRSLPCMYLRSSIVVFAASLPHAIIWCTISTFHIVYQVLNECNFNLCIDDLQAWSNHLH